jgi:hypothetical protein
MFRFHVLGSRTRFRRCRGRRVLLSSFALPDSFSAVPRASGPVFTIWAPGLVFDGTEVFGSHFHILRACTHFLQYRGRQVPFSCFALPDLFSAVPWASGPVFMFCAPELIFNGVTCVGSGLHVLLRFSFSAVQRARGPVFMFCVPELIFGGTEGVEFRFHVLRSRTRFGQYRGRRVSFLCFELSDSFSTVPRASGPIFMFCALGLVFSGTEGVRFLFHVLRG